VQFRGLPREYKEFPIIWAVGTILGVPRAVDTLFTSSTGRARMKVAVLDPTLIPDYVDVIIGDYIYELQFALENGEYDGEPQVIDMDNNKDEDPKGEDPKGAPKEDNLAEEKTEENMEVDGEQGDGNLPIGRQQHGAPKEATLLQDIHHGNQ